MKNILFIIAGLFIAQGLFAAGSFKVKNNETEKISITLRDAADNVLFQGDVQAGAESPLIMADNIAKISFRNRASNEQCRLDFLAKAGIPMPLEPGRNHIIVQKKVGDRSSYNFTRDRMGVLSGDFICEKVK